MLPRKIEVEGKVMLIGEYCENHCPERYDSECESACSLSRELDEEDRRDDDWNYSDPNDWNDEDNDV